VLREQLNEHVIVVTEESPVLRKLAILSFVNLPRLAELLEGSAIWSKCSSVCVQRSSNLASNSPLFLSSLALSFTLPSTTTMAMLRPAPMVDTRIGKKSFIAPVVSDGMAISGKEI
jgi:hypothetical protein